MIVDAASRHRSTAMSRFLTQRQQLGARRDAGLALLRAARLREIEALMASVFAASQDGILVIGEDGAVAMANTAAADLFACGELALSGRPIAALLPDLAHSEVAGGYCEGVARTICGRTFPIECTVTTVGTDGQAVRVLVLRDISGRKSQETALRHQATHDPLTSLPNRTLLARLIEERLAATATDTAPFALLLLDLDRFKEINDTLGHDIGDDLLCQLAERLRTDVASRGLVSRLGGDEFAILLDPVVNEDAVRIAAADLTERIQAPFILRDISLSVEASIGIAMFPDHATTTKELLRCADVAMYGAKRRQSRTATYDAAADRHSIRHLTLSGELKKAVESETMTLDYQPKLSLTARPSLTVEALLRWAHPMLGNISPTEFVPQAERTGLIGPLTDYTLASAVAQMAAWESQGLTISVAVNLSAQVIHDPALPARVDDLLRQHGIAPERLTLELTESAIMHDPEGALDVAQQITEIGIRLSIDDFGTGYSSLAYLSRLPGQELKIDRSFVARMLTSASDALIVHSTIQLAHSLGMQVVAEGIDRLEILKRLVALRCDYGQGFLIAQPTPPDRLCAVMLDAVQHAHDDWGIGVGCGAPDVHTLQAVAAAEQRRFAAMAD